ncbi:SRPBCC family protein [Paenibacillus sp. R14(2021)]|uniref:SRPBCC family protein n=1 Tax=Paenibacillus sp. R14(2021) TaxID=2859228 RepID=UPI001C615AC0|nr:SRPBCC family protein [Paenibacillus sp. R14(2021)]
MNTKRVDNVQLLEEGGQWVVVLEQTLEHACEEVWAVLTQAEKIPSWGPFKPNRDLTETGEVRLTPVGVPEAEEGEGRVMEVQAPHVLVFSWGTDVLRWELSGEGTATVLTLRHTFTDRKQAASYAAGWHLCLDGLTGVAAGKDMPSMAGLNAYKYGWQELHDRYAEQLGLNSAT